MPQNWLNWFAISSLLFLAACATDKPIKQEPTYSSATEQTFEEIERARALDYYRQLRERGNPDQPGPARPRTIRPKPYVERAKPTPRPKPAMTAEQREAVEREVGQNLAYFCMLNRKDSRFSDEAECHAYTQNVLHNCRNQIDENEGRKLVACVKSNLKL